MVLLAMILCVNAQSFNRNEIVDATNKNYANYQALTERFIAGDASLTPDEIRMVYYGYTTNPSFRANAAYPGCKKLTMPTTIPRLLTWLVWDLAPIL